MYGSDGGGGTSSLPRRAKNQQALTGVAQLVGRLPESEKVTGSIPGQGTCLGCRPGPQLGGM